MGFFDTLGGFVNQVSDAAQTATGFVESTQGLISTIQGPPSATGGAFVPLVPTPVAPPLPFPTVEPISNATTDSIDQPSMMSGKLPLVIGGAAVVALLLLRKK